MLTSVFLVFCLFCLSCFAAATPPCADLDVTNCGPYNCIVDAPNPLEPLALKCIEDPCYRRYIDTDKASCKIEGAPACKHVIFIRSNNGTDLDECVSETNHFSDCRLTAQPLSELFLENNGFDANFPNMEKYCKDLGCGGVYQYFDASDNIYFHCEEPNNDGTVAPDDFDVANCKKFNFKVKQNTDGTSKCDWDPCSNYPNDDGDPCPSDSCKELTDDGSTLCVDKSETVCGVASWNLDGITSDGCAAMGCGGLDVAKSIRGNSYLYCLPPPPPPKKNSASYLHVSIFILAITIFAFL